MRRSAWPGIIAATVLAAGCSRRDPPEGFSPGTAQSIHPEGQQSGAQAIRSSQLDFTSAASVCAFGYRGVLLDFGDHSISPDLRPGLLRPTSDDFVEHEGASWLQARSRMFQVAFYWPSGSGDAADPSAYVQGRVRGGTAKSVIVALDGRTVGTWTLVKGETRVVAARASSPFTLAPGGHELTLRFVGGARSGDAVLAEIDWVHVGTGDPSDTSDYAAPTREDVLVDANVGGQSLRALSLRAPGFARCSGWISADTMLEVNLGSSGPGDTEVEAQIVRDRHAPILLGAAHVAGDSGAWAPWSLPITGLEGHGALVSIELVAKRAAKGTRVLFGDPRLVKVGQPASAGAVTAKSVVLVVLGSTSARALAPWGGPHAVPELAGLAASGTTYLAHRASSSIASAVVASILTAGLPLENGFDAVGGRLSDSLTTLQQACREGGIMTAMFTADPTTGAAFGFAQGWDTFVGHDPLEDAPATRVFDDASDFIAAHKAARFFVLVHARGGHPPWDATPDELKSMPPPGYLGIIDPRRAAESLSRVRRHPTRFKDDDRVRAWALYDHAVDEHDAALGRLLGSLRSAGREGDTITIVTGDVAPNEGSAVPFADNETLDEPLLTTPLVIRWPSQSGLAGLHVEAATGPVDFARTILDAFGLAAPTRFGGTDLALFAEGIAGQEQRPSVAERDDRISVRWGSYVLSGVGDRETRLCDLLLDPACVADVRGTSPLALESIRRYALDELSAHAAAPNSSPSTLDAHTMAALARWGWPVDEDGR